MGVHLKIAVGADLQPEPAVHAEGLEHVIEKANPRGSGNGAAVQVRRTAMSVSFVVLVTAASLMLSPR